MNFINRYSKVDQENYYYTKEFVENGNAFILSIGQTQNKGLITKIDTISGDIIWEKTYTLQRSAAGTNIIFRKIIQTGFQDVNSVLATNYNYIIYATNNDNHYLISINVNNGNVIWIKKIQASTNTTVQLEPVHGNINFYLIKSQNEEAKDEFQPTISIYNPSGAFQSGIELPLTGVKVISCKSFSNGIILATRIPGYTTDRQIISLNSNLSIREVFNITSPEVFIDDISVKSENEIDFVCSYSNKALGICLLRYKSVTIGGNGWSLFNFSNFQQSNAAIQRDGNDIYILGYNNSQSLIHKISSANNILWSKRINIEGNYGGISNFEIGSSTSMVNFTISNSSAGSLVSYTTLDWNTCKTEIVGAITLSSTIVSISNSSMRISAYSDSLINESFVVADISSVKNQLCPVDGETIKIDGNTKLQSPNFYLQTAGSDGTDSTKGIHARWIFNGVLGENHLPKGELAAPGNVNFNKEKDFVKLFRTPYLKKTFILDFATIPQLIDNVNKVWIYRFNNDERVFYVYFRNHNRYDQVRQSNNPLTDPLNFITQYGNEIIEVENKKELFFAARIDANSSNINANIELESLSVSSNNLIAAKMVSFRKKYLLGELPNISWKVENGRSIRFRSFSVTVSKIHFEFYSDFISNVNTVSGWKLLGSYSLSLIDNDVFTQLEPEEELVNGSWLRYNDGAFVNIDNYKDKWSRNVNLPDRNLKQIVSSYISLSNDVNNPKANQQFSLIHEDGQVQPGDNSDDIVILSNLDLLRITSYDFHFARMLGLGMMDFVQEIWSGEYVYLAQYYTEGDLQDGEGAREVQHLSMSLPTSIQTQRLPLPVELDRIVPGVFVGTDTTNPTNLTDEEGYSFDGKQRYVTLYHKYFEDEIYNPPFFNALNEFDKSLFTYPVYAGIEYKKKISGGFEPSQWEKPEISHDADYLNVDVELNSFETIPIILTDSPRPLYSHHHTVSGTHYYDTYGINWFSRATRANHHLSVITKLKPKNLLTPPYEINPLLVITESPLMFSSQEEQVRLSMLKSDDTKLDKTLIRLPFYYDIANELLDYRVPEDVINPLDTNSIFPDNDEIYADEIEMFFRNGTPLGTSGKAIDVLEHPSNPLLSLIPTEPYIYLSTGETVIPNIPVSNQNKFIGGLLVIGNQSYIIHEISSDNNGNNLVFTVFKKEVSDGIVLDTIPTINSEELQAPVILNDGLFHTAENMQNEHCWNQSQALPFKVKIGDDRNDFSIHRELIYKINDEGKVEEHLEKSRGFWNSASVQEEDEVVDIIEHVDEHGNITYEEVMNFNGLYKITFSNFNLTQHSQFSETENSVEWWNGVVRLFTVNSFDIQGRPIQSRKPLKVVRTENIGTNQNLILYCEDPNYNIQDPDFNVNEYDKVLIGSGLLVNYYPGYKSFLYADHNFEIDENGIMPDLGEGMRYSIFGLRSVDTSYTFKSKISLPAVMFAREYIGAETPEKPKGGLYATRPDFFGRSTYTFTTKYTHKPFGVLVCRSNDELLLNSLYEPDTVIQIRETLDVYGGQDEEFFTNRWENFLNYDDLINEPQYKMYPLTDGYRFPLPDKKQFFNEINQFIDYHNTKFNTQINRISESDFGNLALNTVIIPILFNQQGQLMKLMDFIQNAIYYSFVPLTEMPIIYNYISPKPYHPVDEKQNVRDKHGYVLPPNDPAVKMAPMMRVELQGLDNSTLYTDFHLDGYSKNFYFYGVREVSSEMKMGEFSEFLGPIKLVNSNPPQAPEVKRIMPVLENPVLGIVPHIQLEINKYPDSQNIRKMNIYRTFDRLKAESVRSMDLVKVVDLEDEGILNEDIWLVNDYFEDLNEIRYGDGIYYRITVSRKIEYAKADYNYGDENSEPEIVVEYAPSNASKIVASLMVDTKSPGSPLLNYSFSQETVNGELLDVIINWDKTVYNGKYQLYKLNSQGNWEKMTTNVIQTNDENIHIALADTILNSGTLKIRDESGNPIYHHFKVVVENSSGILSNQEKILTIHLGPNGNADGIGFMDIGGTFQIN